MSVKTISILKDRNIGDVHCDEHETRAGSKKPVTPEVSPFPSVESVLTGIEAYWETRGLVA